MSIAWFIKVKMISEMKQNYNIPKQIIWFTLFVCILPTLLNFIGIDFSSPNEVIDIQRIAQSGEVQQQSELHHLLRGRFIQTILVSISISIALLTVILAFVDYRIKFDVSTPIVGMALLCAGILNFFQILVATKLISVANEHEFISRFTWFFSRNFHALILIFGVSIFLLRPKNKKSEKKDKRFVLHTSLIFFLLTIMTIVILLVNDNIPRMTFPENFIPQPYDLIPLFIYVIAGIFIFPRFYRKNPSPFSQMLFLSLLPAIFTQLHMAFGSREIFDNHFNIAYFMVSVTYLVPFIGLSYKYIQTHINEHQVIDHLNEQVKERKRAEETLKGVLNSSLSGIMVFKSVRDKENKIIDFEWTLANPSASEIAGMPSQLLLGKKFLEMFPYDKDHRLFDKYVNVVETGKSINYEFFSKWLKKWIHIVAVKLEDGFAQTFEDISERKIAEQELLESRHFNQQIADATPDIIYLFDCISPKIDYINKTITEVLGYTPEEFYQQGISLIISLTHPDDHEKLEEYIKSFSTAIDGEIRELEYRVKDKNGHCKWLKTRNSIFKRTIKGIPSQIIGIVQDITNHKEAEEKLRKSEALLSEAQKLAHYGSWEWDITSNIVTWTDELCRIYGYTPGEMPDNYETYIKHLHPDEVERIYNTIQNSLDTKQPFSFEHQLIQKKGQVRILLTQGKVLTDDEGNAVKVLGSALDITEQKRTLENTLKSEGLYRTLAKNMPDSAVLLFDKNYTLTLADGTAIEALESSIENIIGKNIREIYDKEQYNILFPLYKNALRGEEASFEREINGRFYKIQIMPVKNSEGEIFACMSVSHDITEIKQSQQELELRIEELNRSNIELEQFAYVASHDLQEPLRKIRAFGDRLYGKFNEQLGEDGQNYIERMQNAATRMQILIDDLLTFSRLSRSKDPYTKADLSLIIQDVLNDLEVSIEQKNATIVLEKMSSIEVVPGQIRQLFQNLISNALKFNRENEPPVITISSETITGKDIKGINKNYRNQKYCRISVEDNGIGFEEKYLDRIFVIFQRLHGRNEYKGTGIGLAVCKKILENHNGFITAKSKVNKGSKFIVTLPFKQKNNVQLALPFKQLQDEEIG